MFTDEQLQQLLAMENLSDEEKALARQQAVAQQLRTGGYGGGANARLDWASQLSRAMSGIAGGALANRAQEQSLALGEKRRKMLRDLFGGAGSTAPSAGYSGGM